jgi:hypothetical protein
MSKFVLCTLMGQWEIQKPIILEQNQNYDQNNNTQFNLYFIGKEQAISYNENQKTFITQLS